MSLHAVVMVVAFGTAAPGANAHPAHPAPVVVLTCTGGAVIDLRTGAVRCLSPAVPTTSPHLAAAAPARRYPAALAVPPPPPPAPLVQSAVPAMTTPPVHPAAPPAPAPARRVPRRAVPATPKVVVHHPTPVRDNGIWQVSAPPTSTPSGQTYDPERYSPMDDMLGSGRDPVSRILEAAPSQHVFPPHTGNSHDDGESRASQFVHGLGGGVAACATGAAIGAGTVAGATAAASVLSGGSAALPSAAVAGGAAVGGCVGNIIRHTLTSLQ